METALFMLQGFVRGAVALDRLIDWAQRAEAAGTDDPWLARAAADLSNPLLCREEASAHAFEHLRRWAALEQTSGR